MEINEDLGERKELLDALILGVIIMIVFMIGGK
jgi:hypothetical protein